MITPQILIRGVTLSDVADLANIRSESLQLEPSAMLERFTVELTNFLGNAKWQMFAAEAGGLIVGYGRCEKYDANDGSIYETIKSLPSGWYLRGVAVLRKYQRAGVAASLTSARLSWLDTRTQEVFCFLDSTEKVSTPMYLSQGFCEVSRDWKFHDPSRMETGILFRRLGSLKNVAPKNS